MVLAAAALAACSTDSTGFEEIESGSLAFNYTGARSGSYSATGSFTASTGRNAFQALPFAAGVKINDPVAGQLVGIIAFLPFTASTGHQASFLLPPVTAGQTLDLATSCTTFTFCPLGLLAFDLNLAVAAQDPDTFVFTSGTLTIASVSGGRMAGTFSGVAEDSAGVRTITVTDGTFDVPLVDQSRLP